MEKQINENKRQWKKILIKKMKGMKSKRMRRKKKRRINNLRIKRREEKLLINSRKGAMTKKFEDIIYGYFDNYKNINNNNNKLRKYLTINNNKNKIIFIIIIFLNLITISHSNDITNYSNITLTIKGLGYNNIFGARDIYAFKSQYYPNIVIINGIQQNNISSGYNFNKTINYVQLIWNNTINDCYYMFFDCVNIIEMDLTYFNTSTVTDMTSMFRSCKSLTYLDLTHFDTSKVTNMHYMFYNCNSLTSLDLTHFNTSTVTDMGYMFAKCNSLTYLDLTHFDTSSVISMNSMFEGCISLPSLDLKHFNTSTVTNMYLMLYNCTNLEYINLNFISFPSDSSIDANNMFTYILDNVVICINESNAHAYITKAINYIKCKVIDCSNNWKLNRKKLISKNNTCIDNCIDEYKYEYNGKCYNNCTIYIKNSYYNICINETLEKNILISTETTNILNEIICTETKPFEIIETNTCKENCEINDIIEKKCELRFIKNETQDKNNNIIIEQDIYLKNIEIGFTSENYNISELDGKDIILENNNLKIILTTSDNQKNNKNNNITSIDLGDCEKELRKYYNISYNKKIYMMKIDNSQDGYKIPKIEFYVYSKLNNTNLIKLNLSVCSNINVDIFVPMEIKENLDILNTKSGYYNDICYSSTTDDGIYISLNVRKEKYINEKKAVCQDDCYFDKYDDKTQRVKCSCKVKESPESTKDMIIDIDKLTKNIIKVKNIANMKLLICFKHLFTKDGLISNIGFYSIVLIILLHIVCLFIFFIKQQYAIKRIINDISFNTNKNEPSKIEKSRISKNFKINKYINNKKVNSRTKIKNSNSLKNNKKNSIRNISKKSDIQKKMKKNNPPRKKGKSINIKNNNNNIINTRNNYRNKIIFNNFNINNEKTIESKIETKYNYGSVAANLNKKTIKFKKKNIEYIDEEMNDLSYELALKYDKRTFCVYYISLLRTKHNFIFTFFNNNDYNSKIIKIDLFFISFVIYYFVNAPFFNQDLLDKIYNENGTFDFINQLPQTIYSALISVVLNTFLRLLALSNSAIIKFKKSKPKQNIKEIKNSLLIKLRVKFILFFILGFVFLTFFWYYLSIFSAIYRSTQIHLLKDTLISFSESFISPLGIYLIPGLFRIPALSKPREKRIYLYKFSKILQML